jgi:hypothetical protein
MIRAPRTIDEAHTPLVRGTTFVCEACCPGGELYVLDDCIYFDCPEHIVICMRNDVVLWAKSRGVRQ